MADQSITERFFERAATAMRLRRLVWRMLGCCIECGNPLLDSVGTRCKFCAWGNVIRVERCQWRRRWLR